MQREMPEVLDFSKETDAILSATASNAAAERGVRFMELIE
jgi:hypothetical protein